MKIGERFKRSVKKEEAQSEPEEPVVADEEIASLSPAEFKETTTHTVELNIDQTLEALASVPIETFAPDTHFDVISSYDMDVDIGDHAEFYLPVEPRRRKLKRVSGPLLASLLMNGFTFDLMAKSLDHTEAQVHTDAALAESEEKDSQKEVEDVEKHNAEVLDQLLAERSKHIDDMIAKYFPEGSSILDTLPPEKIATPDFFFEFDAMYQTMEKVRHATYKVDIDVLHREQERYIHDLDDTYQKRLQALIDNPNFEWTGKVLEDFPTLMGALFTGSERMFKGPDTKKTKYLFKADRASEQMSLGLVSCQSSRWTPMVLRDLYAAKGISSDDLLNIRATQWIEHIASGYADPNDGPYVLSELNPSDPVQKGLTLGDSEPGTHVNALEHVRTYLIWAGANASQTMYLESLLPLSVEVDNVTSIRKLPNIADIPKILKLLPMDEYNKLQRPQFRVFSATPIDSTVTSLDEFEKLVPSAERKARAERREEDEGSTYTDEAPIDGSAVQPDGSDAVNRGKRLPGAVDFSVEARVKPPQGGEPKKGKRLTAEDVRERQLQQMMGVPENTDSERIMTTYKEQYGNMNQAPMIEYYPDAIFQYAFFGVSREGASYVEIPAWYHDPRLDTAMQRIMDVSGMNFDSLTRMRFMKAMGADISDATIARATRLDFENVIAAMDAANMFLMSRPPEIATDKGLRQFIEYLDQDPIKSKHFIDTFHKNFVEFIAKLPLEAGGSASGPESPSQNAGEAQYEGMGAITRESAVYALGTLNGFIDIAKELIADGRLHNAQVLQVGIAHLEQQRNVARDQLKDTSFYSYSRDEINHMSDAEFSALLQKHATSPERYMEEVVYADRYNTKSHVQESVVVRARNNNALYTQYIDLSVGGFMNLIGGGAARNFNDGDTMGNLQWIDKYYRSVPAARASILEKVQKYITGTTPQERYVSQQPFDHAIGDATLPESMHAILLATQNPIPGSLFAEPSVAEAFRGFIDKARLEYSRFTTAYYGLDEWPEDLSELTWESIQEMSKDTSRVYNGLATKDRRPIPVEFMFQNQQVDKRLLEIYHGLPTSADRHAFLQWEATVSKGRMFISQDQLLPEDKVYIETIGAAQILPELADPMVRLTPFYNLKRAYTPEYFTPARIEELVASIASHPDPRIRVGATTIGGQLVQITRPELMQKISFVQDPVNIIDYFARQPAGLGDENNR